MSRFSFRSWNSDHSELHKRRACFCRSGENAVSTDGMAAEATRGRDAGEGQQATKALTRLARQDTQWTAAAAHGRALKNQHFSIALRLMISAPNSQFGAAGFLDCRGATTESGHTYRGYFLLLKNEQNRCNALRGALLLPVSFFRAVFCTRRVRIPKGAA